MSLGKHAEIERKYLIRYPDVSLLMARPGAQRWEIVQTYLKSSPDRTRRLRQVVSGGEVRYYLTTKQRLSDLTAIEDEREIPQSDYIALSREADPARKSVVKTRCRVPYRGYTLEFDLYPFWDDRAILEIEMGSEAERPEIPDYVSVIRDVSGDLAYKNSQLAVSVPMEEIGPGPGKDGF